MTVRGVLHQKLRDIFGCDLRALAAFRIGLALLILLDLGDRARDLRAHYTDWGSLPRGALVDLFLHPSALSFHFMNGSWQFQALLFLVAAVFAIGLLLGYRTRVMTVVSWLLLISLQNRNPLVLQGGDIFFRMIAFWAMFLPLGARLSLDARLYSREASPSSQVVVSAATVAILIQTVLLYFFAWLLKTGPEWTSHFTAVYYTMHIDQLTTPAGHWLLGHPDLMEFLTKATLKVELFAPILFFLPFWTGIARILAIVALFAMQMGFGVTIRVFIFPWICFCGTLPLVPSFVWDFLSRRLSSAVAWSHGVFDRIARSLAFKRVSRVLPPRPPVASTSRTLQVLAALALIYVIFWNIGTLPVSLNEKRIDVPRKLKWLGSVFRIDQQWNMFSPFPLKDDGWYVIPGTLRDGSEVDVFRDGAPVSWEKPKYVAYTYKNQRWQKYMMNLWSRDFSKFREFYAKYLCRSWNESHKGGEQLDHFTIYFMREDTRADGEAPPEKVNLWNHYCFKMPGPS